MELGDDDEQDIGTMGAAEADRVSQAGDLPTGEGGDVSPWQKHWILVCTNGTKKM